MPPATNWLREGVPAKPSDSPKTPAAVTVARSSVAQAVNIVSVRFVNFSALTSFRSFDEFPDKLDSKIGFTDPELKRKDNSLAVVSTFLCRLHTEHADPAAPFLDLRATTELVYSHDATLEFSDDELRAFARLNAPFNAWSYWREFTQSSLARLGLPVFPLPLFRVQDVPALILDPKSI